MVQLILILIDSGWSCGSAAFAASHSEIVVVQDRVEQQRKAAVRFVPPHRVVGKHHYVTSPDRNIDYGCFTRKLSTAGEHAADKQVLFRSETQDDPRPCFRWWNSCRIGRRRRQRHI